MMIHGYEKSIQALQLNGKGERMSVCCTLLLVGNIHAQEADFPPVEKPALHSRVSGVESLNELVRER